jgi:hypothetical protein
MSVSVATNTAEFTAARRGDVTAAAVIPSAEPAGDLWGIEKTTWRIVLDKCSIASWTQRSVACARAAPTHGHRRRNGASAAAKAHLVADQRSFKAF